MSDNRILPVAGSSTSRAIDLPPRTHAGSIAPPSLVAVTNSSILPAPALSVTAPASRAGLSFDQPGPSGFSRRLAEPLPPVLASSVPVLSESSMMDCMPVASSSQQSTLNPAPLSTLTPPKKASFIQSFKKHCTGLQTSLPRLGAKLSRPGNEKAKMELWLKMLRKPAGAEKKSGGKKHMTKSEVLSRLLGNIAEKSSADFFRFNLSDVRLSGENLQGFDFEKIVLINAQFNGADLSGGNMRLASLFNADLRNAILTGGCLDTANLGNTKMAGAKLTKMDLRNANLKSAAEVDKADLRGSLLSVNTVLLRTIAATTTLVIQREGDPWPTQDTSLRIPAEWDSDNLDACLNFINNRYRQNLLLEMDSLSAEHDETKIRLARGLINSLHNVNVSSVALPLLYMLYKEPYIQYPDLKVSIERLCSDFMANHRDALLPAGHYIISPALRFFTEDSRRMLTHNELFIQTVLRAINRTTVATEDRQQAIALYDRYLKLEPVEKYQTLTTLGNLEYPPDWQNPEAFNFIMLASPARQNSDVTATAPAIICSQDTLEALLKAEDSDKWERLLTYASPQQYISPQQWRENNHLEKNFTLLHKLQESLKGLEDMGVLLDKLFSLETAPAASDAALFAEIRAMFHKATRLSSLPMPLTDIDKQHALNQIFSPRLEEGTTLTEQHCHQILEIYQLTHASDYEKACLFLALSAAFAKYSSVQHFGEEEDSPEIVRRFTLGHMALAYMLAPDIFKSENDDHFADWKSRLMGEGEAFTCTAVLFDIMKEHMHRHAPACLQYLPPAWGGDARAGDPEWAAANRSTTLGMLPVDPVDIH